MLCRLVRTLSSRCSNERGHIAVQTPPVMIGMVLLAGLAHVLASDTATAKLPGFVPFVMAGVAVLLLGVGIAINTYIQTLPESPFNRHSSSLSFGLMVTAVCGYGIWKIHATDHVVFFWVYGTTAVVAPLASAVADAAAARLCEKAEHKQA